MPVAYRDALELAQRIPSGFTMGVATSSWQIEGASASRGRSIWDEFSETPGRVLDGATADPACDHLARITGDVDLIAGLGVDAYRFSFSWPRLMPEGTGPVSATGLDVYNRLVDEVSERGLTPFATLYHWDLPQALADDFGGWESREICSLFADYSAAVVRRLGDRVTHWATHNEPGVAMEAYLEGTMPPGIIDPKKARQVAHHIMLSHGMAASAIRAETASAKVGIVLDVWPCHPVSDKAKAVQKAQMEWDLRWGWYFEPIAFGRYPKKAWDALGDNVPTIGPGDMDTIRTALDYIGVNYYSRVRYDEKGEAAKNPESSYTAMDWEIYPQGMFEVLDLVQNHYGLGPIYLTEVGAAFDDELGPDRTVNDPDRIAFFKDHLAQVHRAIAAGIDVRGFFAWSLMDNFEWGHGFTKRFGIVYVDYETQERIVKASGRWYAKAANANGFKMK